MQRGKNDVSCTVRDNLCLVVEHVRHAASYLVTEAANVLLSLLLFYCHYGPMCLSDHPQSGVVHNFSAAWMYVFLSYDNFHKVHLHGISVKFLYEGHRVKVKDTEANNAKCDPSTHTLKWQQDYNCHESERIRSLRGVVQTRQWELWCFMCVLDYTQRKPSRIDAYHTNIQWLTVRN